jgi:hypothetical protein
MPAAMVSALCFTVALFMTTAYFLMGSVPLLILKHDTHIDSRFIRGFYNTYYLAAMFTAAGTSLSYAFAGRSGFAIGAAALAILAAALRAKVLGNMDLLRAQIQADHASAISGFRKTHLTAILINLIQMIIIVWSLTTLSL